MFFDSDYREGARLDDGTPAEIRMIRASDQDLLRRGFERLSPESRYRRFLAPKRSLSDRELRYFTNVDGIDHFALIALTTTANGEGEGLGTARFIRLRADRTCAEAAVTVVDDWQGKGLGRLLLLRLIAAARERGVSHFRAYVLADNRKMHSLLEELGGATRIRSADGTVELDVPLPDVPADVSVPPLPVFKQHPVYRVLSEAAKGSVTPKPASS
jgi:GNAT superfamily N-acetyltransferase